MIYIDGSSVSGMVLHTGQMTFRTIIAVQYSWLPIATLAEITFHTSPTRFSRWSATRADVGRH
jgi:hypothetical protein